MTRSSIITLLQEQGRSVTEGDIALSEVVEGLATGEFTEAFACGTAAVVTPIGRLAGDGFDLTVGSGQTGELTREIYSTLTDIQYGRREDTHAWMTRLV